MRPRATVIALVAAAAASACSQHAGGVYAYPAGCSSELMRRFTDGDPVDKMGAAELLAQRDCTEAVPLILGDLRRLYATYRCEPPGGGSDDIKDDTPSVQCFVTWNGREVPYVDYHEPLFKALVRLTGIAYFDPDAAWYAELDRWIERRQKGGPTR